MLKHYNYELIVAIGKKKKMSEDEIDDLLEQFWKVQYYSPEVVASTYKEEIQKYF
tara:strand:+ start:1040 stop:1204 length:165 start_codon:yes stop_codon:yes gene_type:complete